jgi:hypothetical protein
MTETVDAIVDTSAVGKKKDLGGLGFRAVGRLVEQARAAGPPLDQLLPVSRVRPVVRLRPFV